MPRKSPWKTKKEWIDYGSKKGYKDRESGSLEKSEDKYERAWYNKGSRNKWLRDFKFNRIYKFPWKTEQEWIDYGIQKGYDHRNYCSLSDSNDSVERSWIIKGTRKKWISRFNFNNIQTGFLEIKKLTTLKEWIKYGIDRSYDKKSPTDILESEDERENSWYKKGAREKWIKYFNFNPRIEKSPEVIKELDDLNKWLEYGYKNNYHHRTCTQIRSSENIIERSWLTKGTINKWLKDFIFKTNSIKEIRELKNCGEWSRFGIDNGYDQRSPKSLSKSEDKIESSWYRKGARNNWLNQFNFKRLIDHYNSYELESMLEEYAGGNE